ncbi:MAG: TraB/GumN family protein [Proteiniphilum sp.]|nr:TraB/GumN family protein [Proteiniphilum sp.]MDD4158532.1 TraB/GumN family protein [Proteiniphilum sp.]MDD4799947.1 TraB/GumN family protein [Proteiniphilum sp.]
MTRKHIGAFLVLLLLISCSSLTSGSDNSLLWKVSGNGLKKPSYLFGTHHLVPLTFLDSIPGIQEAFESAEQTVGELNIDNMVRMQADIMGRAMLPEGTSYEMLLSEADRAKLDSTLTSLMGMGLAQFGRLRPAMLQNLISVTLYQRYYPTLTGGTGLDQYFQEEARKRSRPVQGLENTDDQIYVLLEMQPLERQAEMLACMVKHPEMLKEQMDELQRAYHAQDLDALWALYTADDPDDPCPSTEEEKHALNGARNAKWMKKLPAIMAEKSSFIAVGCLHLPGEEGLIEGLRKLGYKVAPVR